jgi:hypothetical protein
VADRDKHQSMLVNRRPSFVKGDCSVAGQRFQADSGLFDSASTELVKLKQALIVKKLRQQPFRAGLQRGD